MACTYFSAGSHQQDQYAMWEWSALSKPQFFPVLFIDRGTGVLLESENVDLPGVFSSKQWSNGANPDKQR